MLSALTMAIRSRYNSALQSQFLPGLTDSFINVTLNLVRAHTWWSTWMWMRPRSCQLSIYRFLWHRYPHLYIVAIHDIAFIMTVAFLQFLSYLFGWIYTTCWSLSFYPQPLLNFRRKSTSGAAIDFPFLNVLGFAAYFVSTVSFLYAPEIRREYALRNNGHTPTVQFNDLAFAVHALFMCFVIISQYEPSIWGFDKRGKRGPGARVSKSIMGLSVACIVGVATSVVIVLARQDEDVVRGWAWIDVVRWTQAASSGYTCANIIVHRFMSYHMSNLLSRLWNICPKSLRIIAIDPQLVGQ